MPNSLKLPLSVQLKTLDSEYRLGIIVNSPGCQLTDQMSKYQAKARLTDPVTPTHRAVPYTNALNASLPALELPRAAPWATFPALRPSSTSSKAC